MRTAADVERLETGLNGLLNSAEGLTDEQLCHQLVAFLHDQMKPWCGGINQECACEAFRWTLQKHGRGALAECVLEWAEECADDLRWPVACVYRMTGTLPGAPRENTTLVIVAQNRSGKVLGHHVLNWCDFEDINDDAECYTALNRAITDAAESLKARSVFYFDCDTRLSKHMRIAYLGEQTDFSLWRHLR